MTSRYSQIFVPGLWAVLLLLPSCASDAVVDDSSKEQESTDPMRFTSYSAVAQNGTRAGSTSLTQGFLVSCWKAYARQAQLTVMDKYEVQYSSNQWYGTSAWNYVGQPSSFYQTQIERYWDYNSFPYRFHAITPCPSHDAISAFTLTDQQLHIPSTVSYRMQTVSDGVLSVPTAEAEPFLVAQVDRDAAGKDHDYVIKGTDGKPAEINATATTLNRSVALPFHHLTSKIRFGIYATDEDVKDDMRISNLTVKIISTDFVTEAKDFTASLSSGSALEGTFASFSRTDAGLTLIATTTDNDDKALLKNCTNKNNAYMGKCDEGILQMPQQGVRMKVSLTIGEVSYIDEPVVLVQPDGTTTDTFTWEPNTIYTYYLVLKRFAGRQIEFTCSLVPWDDISGSLITDLEK